MVVGMEGGDLGEPGDGDPTLTARELVRAQGLDAAPRSRRHWLRDGREADARVGADADGVSGVETVDDVGATPRRARPG